MYLGMSKIRSAGRTSGSIEMTLPPALQAFTGLGCRVMVRDGLQPEIVLQPDFGDAWSSVEALWEKLRLALGSNESIGDVRAERFHADPAAATAFAARPAARLLRSRHPESKRRGPQQG